MSGAPQTADTSRSGWKHGKAIVNGEVRFASVSAIEKADSSSSTGCLRKYWFDYKGGIKEPKNKDTDRGVQNHGEVATYLTTGERGHLSSLVLSGLHQLPPPGPDLLVEWDMIPDLPDGSSGLALAKVRVADIPLLGQIDLCHARPENYGVQDPSSAIDEPGVIKLVDHKFPNTLNNAKSPSDLPETYQMAGYGLWAFEMFPGIERVRLTHNYFPTKGTPRAPTILVDRDPLEKTWRRATAVANSMKHAARESNPDLVDANVRACRAYGRDCPAKVAGVCRAVSHNSLAFLVGGTAAARLLTPPSDLVQIGKRPNGPGILQETTTEELSEMTLPTAPTSLIARLQAQRAGQAGPPPALTAPVQSLPPVPTQVPVPAPVQVLVPVQIPAAVQPPVQPQVPVPTNVLANVQAEMARLAALETAASSPSDPILDVLAEIDACGLGRPVLGGAAAIAYAAARARGGVQLVPNADGQFPGVGEIGVYTIDDPSHLSAVRDEVRNIVAKRAAVASVTPPTHTPTTDPPKTEETSAKKPRAPRKKKSDTTTTAVQADHVVETTVASTNEVAPVAPVVETSVTTIVNVVEAPIASAVSSTLEFEDEVPPPAPVVIPPSRAINVYVDCVVVGIATQSIWPIVDYLCTNMNHDAAQADGSGNFVVTDFRCADPNSKYGFGRWKGVLAACLRECPAKGILPPGNYTLDGAMGDIGGVVAETMRQISAASGGVFVKGAR